MTGKLSAEALTHIRRHPNPGDWLLLGHIDALQAENKALRTEVAALTAGINVAKSEIGRCTAEIESLRDEINHAWRQV